MNRAIALARTDFRADNYICFNKFIRAERLRLNQLLTLYRNYSDE